MIVKMQTRGAMATRFETNEVELVVEVKGNRIVIHMAKFGNPDELIGTVRLSETDGTVQLFTDESG